MQLCIFQILIHTNLLIPFYSCPVSFEIGWIYISSLLLICIILEYPDHIEIIATTSSRIAWLDEPWVGLKGMDVFTRDRPNFSSSICFAEVLSKASAVNDDPNSPLTTFFTHERPQRSHGAWTRFGPNMQINRQSHASQQLIA